MATPARSEGPPRYVMRKLPEVTVLFWALKIVAVTLGETAGDLLGITLPTLLFWTAFILTRPLGAAGGDSLIKPVDQGGLGWGTLAGSLALFALLVVLVAYETYRTRRNPPAPLAYPINRRTGAPQQPNGALVPAGGWPIASGSDPRP